MDFRKGIIAVIIAILFTLLVFTTVDAFLEPINYSECYNQFDHRQNITDEQIAEQQECTQRLSDIREQQEFIRFVVSAIAGLIAVIAGLSISAKTGVGMAISSGVLLGGLFTIFFGTITNFGSIDVRLRPIIILIQIIIVIIVAYVKLSPKEENKKIAKTKKRT